MHGAEHRGLRELTVVARRLAEHWPRLADRLREDEAALLRAGAADARELLAELEPLAGARGLSARPGAQGLGAQLGLARAAVVDRALEVNQALRLAGGAAAHVATLLAYLERLAGTRGDAELEAFHARWGRRLAAHEDAVRRAAVAVGAQPDRAVAPAVPGPTGRAGHALAYAVGSLGEAVDQAAARLRG
jgi:hypothetical protein